MTKRDRRFNLLAPIYDWSMTLAELALTPYRQDLFSRATGRVLEIGIGTGATLPYYPPGCQVVGIDTSPSMLRRAGKKAERLGVEFTPVIMNAERMSFPDGYFDTVVSSLVLCSVGNPLQVLCEIRRILRPDGRALFLEHVRPSGALGMVFDMVNVVWGQLVCQLTLHTESLVKRAGFELVDRKAPVDFLRVMEAAPGPAGQGCGD